MKLSYLEPRRGNTKMSKPKGSGGGRDEALLSARPRTRVSPWRAKSCQSEHARTKSRQYGRMRTVLPAAAAVARGRGRCYRRLRTVDADGATGGYGRRLQAVLPAAADGGYGRCYRRLRTAATDGATGGCGRRLRTVLPAAADGGYGRCYRRLRTAASEWLLTTMKTQRQNSS